MIVYPMGLPPHDPIKQELENTEDLSGTQVRSKTDVHVSRLYLNVYICHIFNSIYMFKVTILRYMERAYYNTCKLQLCES